MTEPRQEILTDKVSTIACTECGQSVDVSAFDAFSDISCPHCSAVQAVPAQFAHFLLVKQLGAGGMGRVFHAFDPNLNRFVAIKVMHVSLGEDEQFVENFRREAQAAAGLNHPNIVQIYSFGTQKGQPYIVMEYLPGKRFNALIEEEGPLAPGFVAKVGVDIANGLNAASSAGLLHGDVKPENIVLNEQGTAKLVDFGLAANADKLQESGVWGSPYYIAPENVARQRVDSRSDMYSLGASLYHALAGAPPFDGEDPVEVAKARLTEPPTPLQDRNPELPEALTSAIERMLSTDPARRHPTYASLIADLEEARKEIEGADSGKQGRPRAKVQIKKRSSTAPASLSGRRGKVIVTRSKSRSTDSSASRTSSEKEEGTGRQDRGAGARKEPPKKKKKKTGPGKWIALGIVLTLVAGGGYYGYHISEQDKLARFKMKRTAEQLFENADTDLQWMLGQGVQMARVRGAATNAMLDVDLAAAEVFPRERYETVAGQVRSILAALGPAMKQADADDGKDTADDAPDTDGAADDAETGDEADAADEPPAPKKAPAKAADRVDEAGRIMPAGLNPLRIGESIPAEPEKVPEPAPRNRDPYSDIPGVPPIRPERIPSLPELVSQDRAAGIYTNSATAFRDVLEQFGLMMMTTNSTATLVRGMRSQLDQLLAADNTPTAETLLTSVKEYTPKIDAAMTEFNLAMTNAVDALEILSERHETFMQIRNEAVAERDRMRREREESIRKREAYARKYREEQAYKQRVQEELVRVEQLHENKKRLYLKGNHFRKGHSDFLRARREFETKEGEAALQVVLDRWQGLVDLKLFLIESINNKTCEWCWKKQVDVVSANPFGIKIRTLERTLPWDEVDVQHMIVFIRTYLQEDNNTLERQERAVMTMNAGIFCLEHGATEAAQAFRNRALGIWDRGAFKENIDRLLPAQGNSDVLGF